MKVVFSISNLLSIGSAVFAGASIVLILTLVCVDVLLRVYGFALEGTVVIVTNYLMVMVAYLPLAEVERVDKMITVDVLTTLLTPWGRRVVRLVAAIVSVCVYLALAQSTWSQAMAKLNVGAYRILTDHTLLVWPAYFVVPVSCALAAVVVVLRIWDPHQPGRQLT